LEFSSYFLMEAIVLFSICCACFSLSLSHIFSHVFLASQPTFKVNSVIALSLAGFRQRDGVREREHQRREREGERERESQMRE